MCKNTILFLTLFLFCLRERVVRARLAHVVDLTQKPAQAGGSGALRRGLLGPWEAPASSGKSPHAQGHAPPKARAQCSTGVVQHRRGAAQAWCSTGMAPHSAGAMLCSGLEVFRDGVYKN